MHANTPQTDKEISDYFKATTPMSEMEILGNIVDEILQSGHTVTNKSIISKLVTKIELETDTAFLDRYRALLDLVVHKTQDDFLV
ncbi:MULTISPECIES: biofilm/acid-resistance regulator YmgB/AriR [unclassified Brenneria]|uniref:biofilm/acid-resistance regulator YmgB/AriR n=1 Tax=unclassified Brenneria TaxID=2634434 RepID=UPI0015553E97|nr:MULTISPECIES: biofilm/acid-resistance regulator YmgB/AriR [unclassified Brenneria]MBJ7221149.1 DNA-binding response regulator [Brenneria sp. L3-3C-1]MEE3642390.1 biofilm/acid-resistance regulator YmgB/AriR [Brenneria sp. L3_3C_1]MEE3650239.1 biofilm/acid-resistance regulator YmgB/AriR [Brenneria sp. HEZEL_4_2_4]NPD00195.1 DNA-binding response regulator [Brenneria sp. hezel4-2-4]